MTDNNVVFLKYRNDAPTEVKEIIACKVCRNKTFLALLDKGPYPRLQCAACGSHIGAFGWAPEEGEAT